MSALWLFSPNSGDQWSEAWGTLPLASALLARGRAPDAEPRLRRAIETFERFGDRRSTAMALVSHGEALLAMDDAPGAATRRHEAATIYDELGDDQAAALRTRAASLERGQVDARLIGRAFRHRLPADHEAAPRGQDHRQHTT